MVYTYGTGDRDDGMRFAVGMVPEGADVIGSVALFREKEHSTMFANALGEKHECTVIITETPA